MTIYPAIDLFGGKAVRLYKGNYDEMTVYSDSPADVALDFKRAGATHIHVVDLEGARLGKPLNADTVQRIIENSGLFLEIGGGIRSMASVKAYLDAGASRVILGTAAVKDPDFLREALSQYGDKIAVGIDIRDSFVAVNGWLEKTEKNVFDFCKEMESLGVKTVICTDISKDGAMAGTNRALYRELASRFSIEFIASGGVSSLEDVAALRDIPMHGAIIGKAYYTGAIDLHTAIEVAK